MGRVYRALDRLTGRVVTLKRLRTDRHGDGLVDDRMLLAREFRVLAALRHPNIISVLDYGFDQEGQPYYAMDLEENARTIVEAGRQEPMAVQLDFLVQALRALIYLHRHGIIHRDLKPENVLVVNRQVKVLDFGLSVSPGVEGADDESVAGTLAYMAPELLRGALPSERSDLWAIGMIAYELLVGRYPFVRDDAVSLMHAIADTPLPRATDELDPRLRPVLERLLARAPEDRYADAAAVIAALAGAVKRELPVETVATRESFLQAAPLIGRDEELATLVDILNRAPEGKGSAWVVGGESGIGKSRLLDEVRTRALVDGTLVAFGQARSQGGGPYHPWHDVISTLVLRTDLDDARAAVLKVVLPDIGVLLGREIEDPPALDPESAQSQLLLAIEEVFRLQREPVLVVLEDLQWAGSESLRLWSWLARAAGSLRLALLGTFRNDEAPELPRDLGSTQPLVLRRLEAREIARLAESMIGSAGRSAALIRFLERETEGIPFFLVEVVRALAENAGTLESISDAGLPERVLSGGMHAVVRRRIRQVPRPVFPALETAAVIGRAIDGDLLRALHPDLDLDLWTAACCSAAMLAVQDGEWRFAHDKLREQMLD